MQPSDGCRMAGTSFPGRSRLPGGTSGGPMGHLPQVGGAKEGPARQAGPTWLALRLAVIVVRVVARVVPDGIIAKVIRRLLVVLHARIWVLGGVIQHRRHVVGRVHWPCARSQRALRSRTG